MLETLSGTWRHWQGEAWADAEPMDGELAGGMDRPGVLARRVSDGRRKWWPLAAWTRQMKREES